MKSTKAFFIKALASCAYLSYLPSLLRSKHGKEVAHKGATGAGFIGSLAGLCTVRWLPVYPWQAIAVLMGGVAIAVAVSDNAEREMGRVDDPRIVIDEWIGYLIAIAFLPPHWTVWLTGFIFFRIFDVWKPLGIRRLGTLPGGWGIVIDDVVAGVYTNILLQAAHGFHWL